MQQLSNYTYGKDSNSILYELMIDIHTLTVYDIVTVTD